MFSYFFSAFSAFSAVKRFSSLASGSFHVTYIRTTPEKLWQALIDPEFTRRYWCETRQDNTSAGWPIFTGARPASFLVASRFVPVTMGERRDPARTQPGVSHHVEL